MDNLQIHIDFLKIHVDFQKSTCIWQNSRWFISKNVAWIFISNFALKIHVDSTWNPRFFLMYKKSENPREFKNYHKINVDSWHYIKARNPRGFRSSPILKLGLHVDLEVHQFLCSESILDFRGSCALFFWWTHHKTRVFFKFTSMGQPCFAPKPP